MNSSKKIMGMDHMKGKLSSLWLFAVLNYLYCDVIGLMDSNLLRQYITGTVNGMQVSQGFLLGASVLIEIPIAMVLLSHLLSYKENRWTNIIAGTIMTVVQIATLFVGSPTNYYLFFSIIEIATTSGIVWTSWTWSNPVREYDEN